MGKMSTSSRYVKIVEWSDEDQCYVGSCPGLFYGGCHGNNEQEVFSELGRIVEETIELYQRDGRSPQLNWDVEKKEAQKHDTKYENKGTK